MKRRSLLAAGLATVITPSPFTTHHDFTGALRVLPHLGELQLAQLREWLPQARRPHNTASPTGQPS